MRTLLNLLPPSDNDKTKYSVDQPFEVESFLSSPPPLHPHALTVLHHRGLVGAIRRNCCEWHCGQWNNQSWRNGDVSPPISLLLVSEIDPVQDWSGCQRKLPSNLRQEHAEETCHCHFCRSWSDGVPRFKEDQETDGS